MQTKTIVKINTKMIAKMITGAVNQGYTQLGKEWTYAMLLSWWKYVKSGEKTLDLSRALPWLSIMTYSRRSQGYNVSVEEEETKVDTKERRGVEK